VIDVATRELTPQLVPKQRRRVGPSLVVPALAVVVSGIAVRSTSQANIGSLGLVQALPPVYFAAAAAVGAALAWEVTRPSPRRSVLAVDIATLIVVLYGLPITVVSGPRVESGFATAGFVEMIRRTGQVVPNFDARFSWPGGFAWAALFEHTGSIGSQVALLRWSPIVLTSLYLLPIYVIAASVTTEPRWRWAALAIFLIADWVSQDYFSPQGISYLLYLCLIATVLCALRGEDALAFATARPIKGLRRWIFGNAGAGADPPSALRHWPVMVSLVLITSVVVTHQLTPVIIVVSLAALAWYRHTRTWALALASAALFLAYLSYGALGYWRGHLAELFGGVGRVGSTAAANVGNRLHGDPGHLVVVDLRIAFVVVLVAAAGLAYLRRPLPRSNRRLLALLAIAPFSILSAQSYGGEGLLRSYFFALPFASILLASLLPRSVVKRSAITTIVVTALTVGAIPLLLVTRYGNDAFDASNKGEIAGVTFALAHAPRGAPIAAFNQHFPWEFSGLDQHRWEDFDNDLATSVPATEAELEREPGTWLLITNSQEQYGRLVEGRPAGWTSAIANTLLGSDKFAVAWRTADVMVLVNTLPRSGAFQPPAEVGAG
jgi:hypothetical protein